MDNRELVKNENKICNDELVEIKKELQNIRLLLEFLFIPEYEIKRVDGKRVRTLRSHEALLEGLRKSQNISE